MDHRDDHQRCIWPQWDSEREITHYLDGFVGPIRWMIAHSMNTSPARYPTFQLGVLHLKRLLNEYTSRWGFNLAPRHRRRRSPQWTRGQWGVFEEYITEMITQGNYLLTRNYDAHKCYEIIWRGSKLKTIQKGPDKSKFDIRNSAQNSFHSHCISDAVNSAFIIKLH